MAEDLDGKVALVTGGGSGIGRAIAAALAADGAAVVVAGRRQGALDETVAHVSADGGTVSAETADVSKADDVSRLVDAVLERHGELNIAVNNAATVGKGAPLDEVSEEVWDQVISTNLTGTWLCMKAEIAHMRKHGGGVIVNIGSNLGAHMVRPRMGAYAASKAAVNALTRVAAIECIDDGIRVNSISPGATDTEMSFRPGESEEDRAARIREAIPIRRLGTVEEIAGAVVWMASDRGAFAVGQDFVLDGGATIAV